MTEERKQELRELLAEAMGSLVVQHGFGLSSIPVDVYRKYLEERWACYGVGFFSWALLTYFTLKIENEITNSRFLHFISEELAQYMHGNDVSIAACKIECDPSHGSRLSYIGYPPINLYLLMERLLKITLVRGIEAAVSVFDRCSAPEGVQNFFQDIALLEGIKIETEIPVYEGVRLVPLPSSDTSEQLMYYLPGIPHSTFNQVRHFFNKTLLVIDRPGFSVCQKPAPHLPFQDESLVDDLPFQIEVPDVKFPNSEAVNSFKILFCQALSLVCNTSVQIVNEGWFVASDKSFNLDYRPFNLLPNSNRSITSFMAGPIEIEQTKCQYSNLINLDSNTLEKLQISINRWIRSKAPGNYVDKMIDLGIALEALYVPDGGGDLNYKFSIRAARHLGKDKEHREDLLQKFKHIYEYRSKAVHNGQLEQRPKFGKERIPLSEFIAKTQDLCQESIMKVVKKKQSPNLNYWNSLILGGEDEQAGS